MDKVNILGIETSCDDTSICLLNGDPNDLQTPPAIRSFKSFDQDTILKNWGGIVPEIAARNHMLKLRPLLEEILDKAKASLDDLDSIAITTYPGLLGPLLTGLNTAKTISLLTETPLIPVNHLYAHLEAIHLTEVISYPYLGLLVSGGHSMFLLAHSPYNFELIGTTIDDAAGEAFDKGGKLLGLDYPAGKIIDQLAKEGDPKRFDFPIGMKSSKNSTMSFSGVKTSLRQFTTREGIPEGQALRDVCASYQNSIVTTLKLKLRYALSECQKELDHKIKNIVVGGGVAANSCLRETLTKDFDGVSFVKPKFCTDNGAMVANYGLRIKNDMEIPFPQCLEIDARSRFINKNIELKKAKQKGHSHEQTPQGK